ncbi:hypothetical protein OG874_24600 [Nocardia sp. NBC_00565]|uniref:hypothetical protein n=1 Tax=Nocardia sp. NBC_00565 TaxID=2975993 RepID=UPI002E81DA11|nr:hypothetical protein [Nocardia sp. NBC_00565]WUC00086.1 hypothetical protein OG874_24600 [Nocardia sp. NBC_00565]
MKSVTSVFALPATGVIAAAALLTVAAPASAASGDKFQTIYSLTNGACIAVVDSSVHGPGYPSSASFTVNTNIIGVGACALDVTLQWRNVDTGETGSRTVHATGPGNWISDPKSSIFQPGFGTFESTVTVNGAHLGESGQVEFAVEPYQG